MRVSRSAAALTAIVAGSLPVSAGSPIGHRMVSMVSDEKPSSARFLRKRCHLAREPISPIEPRSPRARAAEHRCRSSAWSWVMMSTWLPGGRLEDVGGYELFWPGVGYDEVEVVSAQYPGEFESDVADAEDRRRGGHGQRFEQHRDLPAAALTTVFGRRLVVEPQGQHLRTRLAGGQQFAGTGESRHLEIASADGSEQVIGGDEHIRSGLARCVAAHRGESDEDGGHPSPAEL